MLVNYSKKKKFRGVYIDYIRRQQYVKFEYKKNLLRSLYSNYLLEPLIRLFVYFKILIIPLFAVYSRQRCYCIFSGRSRGIVSKFGLSRFFFIYFFNYGLFCGWRRLSW